MHAEKSLMTKAAVISGSRKAAKESASPVMKAWPLALALLMTRLVAAETPAKFGRLAAGSIAEDFAVSGVDGKEIKLSDFKGKKIFLITWASW